MSVQFVRWVFGANQHRATSLCFLSEHTSEHNGTRLENSSVIFLHEPTCCACVVSKQHHCKSIFSQPLLCLNSPSPRSTLCLWRQLTLTLLLVPHLALPQQHVPLLNSYLFISYSFLFLAPLLVQLPQLTSGNIQSKLITQIITLGRLFSVNFDPVLAPLEHF